MKKKVSVDLDEIMLEKIQRIAKKNHRSVGGQIRQIIADYDVIMTMTRNLKECKHGKNVNQFCEKCLDSEKDI